MLTFPISASYWHLLHVDKILNHDKIPDKISHIWDFGFHTCIYHVTVQLKLEVLVTNWDSQHMAKTQKHHSFVALLQGG